MHLTNIETWNIPRAMKAPFAIAYKVQTDVQLHVVRLTTDTGVTGIGACVPNTRVTGETNETCAAALQTDALGWLDGQSLDGPPRVSRLLKAKLPNTPAAGAAIEMAVWDAWARQHGRPLCDLLGRAHLGLPTSMTLGLRSLEETRDETKLFLGMGYTVLKIKLGTTLEEDIARVRMIREIAGPEILLRVDPNQAFDEEALQRFLDETSAYQIDFIEQPLPMGEYDTLCDFPAAVRKRIALDEDLKTPADALTLAEPPGPCGIYNIKLSKCGGIHAALGIARIAEAAGIALMWGCMIESAIGLSAALHAALACPNTRYLDLDGDYDLVQDVCTGGYVMKDGVLYTCEAPGLGAELTL